MPCGRRENSQDYYVVRDAVADYSDYWDPKADPDGVVRDRNTEAERKQYLEDVADELEFVNNLRPRNVLDFGAGLGWFLSGVYCDYRLAIEPCWEAFERCKEVADFTYNTLDRALENQDREYDVAIAHHVFEHLTDPINSLIKLRKLLSPGGYLVLGTPDFGSPCAKRFGENYRMLHDKTHCSLFTLESMTRFLRDHAFEIIDVKFPFPARYATAENFLRWNDTTKTSGPFPGNWMTFYARRAGG